MLIQASEEASADSEDNLKICTQCCFCLPITAFRLYRKDGDKRHAECNACHNRSETERKRDKKAKRFRKLQSKLIRARSQRELRIAAALLISGFGGTAQFAQYFAGQVMAAGKRTPGGQNVLHGCKGVMKLVELAEKLRPAPLDMSGLTEDDLKQVIRETTSEEWRDDPGYDSDAPDDDIMDEEPYV